MGAGRIDELLQPSLRALVQIEPASATNLFELRGSATGHVYDILVITYIILKCVMCAASCRSLMRKPFCLGPMGIGLILTTYKQHTRDSMLGWQ